MIAVNAAQEIAILLFADYSSSCCVSLVRVSDGRSPFQKAKHDLRYAKDSNQGNR